MAAVIATQDAVILGRRSYDEWARFWPESDIEPFATFINAVAKYVVTSTPLDREWANARVDRGRPGRVRPGAAGPARRRHRRPRQHLGRSGAAGRGRGRRTQAGDRCRRLPARDVGSLTDCRPSGSNRSAARRRQPGTCSWITASFVSRADRFFATARWCGDRVVSRAAGPGRRAGCGRSGAPPARRCPRARSRRCPSSSRCRRPRGGRRSGRPRTTRRSRR